VCLPDVIAAGSYAKPYVSIHVTTQKAPQAKSGVEVIAGSGANLRIVGKWCFYVCGGVRVVTGSVPRPVDNDTVDPELLPQFF
jgi:hypothetical protein